MSARDAIAEFFKPWVPGPMNRSSEADALIGRLAEMPLADRLALARALVAPEGLSVGKVPEEKDVSGGGHGDGYKLRSKMGWNACRAAFLASTGDDNGQR